jgi:hypothetical protein
VDVLYAMLILSFKYSAEHKIAVLGQAASDESSVRRDDMYVRDCPYGTRWQWQAGEVEARWKVPGETVP